MEIAKNSRLTTSIAVYLILRREDQVLLLLRKNTGFMDNYYGLVSGHVEINESGIAALIREAQEESGIIITQEDLALVHTFHRKSNKPYLDLFFECRKWEGNIINMEPEKCADLSFFPIDSLPKNIIDYVKHVLKEISIGKIYSEAGWAEDYN